MPQCVCAFPGTPVSSWLPQRLRDFVSSCLDVLVSPWEIACLRVVGENYQVLVPLRLRVLVSSKESSYLLVFVSSAEIRVCSCVRIFARV